MMRLLVVIVCVLFFFFFKQKTAYEMRISDWSSDVCSSDLPRNTVVSLADGTVHLERLAQRRIGEQRHVEFAIDLGDLLRGCRPKGPGLLGEHTQFAVRVVIALRRVRSLFLPHRTHDRSRPAVY